MKASASSEAAKPWIRGLSNPQAWICTDPRLHNLDQIRLKFKSNIEWLLFSLLGMDVQWCCVNANPMQVCWKTHWNYIRWHDVGLTLPASKRSDNSNLLKATFVICGLWCGRTWIAQCGGQRWANFRRCPLAFVSLTWYHYVHVLA